MKALLAVFCITTFAISSTTVSGVTNSYGDGAPSTTGVMPTITTYIDSDDNIATWHSNNGNSPGGQGGGFAGTDNNIIADQGVYLGSGFVDTPDVSVAQFADPGALSTESTVFLSFDWEVGAEDGGLALDDPTDNTFTVELLALDQDGAPGAFATGWEIETGGTINNSTYTKIYALTELSGVTADAYGSGTALVSFDPQEFGADFENLGIRITATNVMHTDSAGLTSNQGSEFIRLSNFTLSNVPEPSAGLLLGLTGLALLLMKRRRTF